MDLKTFCGPDNLSVDRWSAALDQQARSVNSRFGEGKGRVYAISFDMDVDLLKKHHGDPYNNAYAEIRRVLTADHGFSWQQGSVYFGGETVNAVTCVLAAIDLARRLPWFAASIRDIRMLRIEELNDLLPAIHQANPPRQGELFET